MASGVTFRVEGVEALQKHLDKIVTSSNVQAAVVQGTAMMLSTAKHLAPTAKHGNSKGLKNNIHMDIESTENATVGKVYTAQDYAMYVEFGTGIWGERSKHPTAVKKGFSYAHYKWLYTPDEGDHFFWTDGHEARPFMYPALKQNKTKIIELITDAMKKGIK